MDINVYSINDIGDEKIKNMIYNHESFVLVKVKHKKESIIAIVKLIKEMEMSCRIYTKGRSILLIAAIILFFRLTYIKPLAFIIVLICIAIGIGIIIHNIFTMNSDYEIGRTLISNKLYVRYKKRKKQQ